jgi:hypothetical protein
LDEYKWEVEMTCAEFFNDCSHLLKYYAKPEFIKSVSEGLFDGKLHHEKPFENPIQTALREAVCSTLTGREPRLKDVPGLWRVFASSVIGYALINNQEPWVNMREDAVNSAKALLFDCPESLNFYDNELSK